MAVLDEEGAMRAAEKRRMLMEILNVRLSEAHSRLVTDYTGARPAAPRKDTSSSPLRGGED